MKKKKDILINASILSENNTGLGRYTYQVLEHVCPLLDERGISYEVICGSASITPESVADHVLETPSKGFIARLLKAELAGMRSYRLAWSTTQHGFLFPRGRQVISIHDVTPVLYPEGRLHQSWYYQHVIPWVLRTCAGIITVSENTKKDILRIYGKQISDSDTVKVVYESIDPPTESSYDFSRCAEKYAISDGSYFCVTGIHYPYKNLDIIIDAFKSFPELDHTKVLFIGNNKNEYGRHLVERVSSEELSRNLVFTGFVSDEERDSLISHCAAAVYPSLYEGFGLPVLEAMQMGVPVISSNASSLPEVGGDAAIFFDPSNAAQLKDAMLGILGNPVERERRALLGRQNLARFSWNKIARDMVDYFESLLGEDKAKR